MSKVTVKIDGKTAQVEPETTILRAAQQLGISIPTLCYHPAIDSYGACRVCMVEVKEGKWSRMVTSCNYPIRKDGLEVETRSERALRTRRLVLELMLARCPGVEVVRELAREAGVEESRFPEEDGSEKCILCGLCVNVCSQVVGASAIGFIGRGVDRKVETPFLIQSDVCIGCGACAYVCPTGAITLQDIGKFRKIEMWHANLEQSECIRCGRPVATPKHIEEILSKLNVTKDYLKVCPTCRGQEYAKQILLTQGGASISMSK